jgi:hypothetical protein
VQWKRAWVDQASSSSESIPISYKDSRGLLCSRDSVIAMAL